MRFLYLLERIVKFFVRQSVIQFLKLGLVSVPDKFFHELVLRVNLVNVFEKQNNIAKTIFIWFSHTAEY